MNSDVDRIIQQQTLAFEEVLYKITDPQLTPNQRLDTIEKHKERYFSLMSDLVKYYKQIPEATDNGKTDRQKLKDFIQKYKSKWTDAKDEYVNLTLGEPPKYKDESTNSKVLSPMSKKEPKYVNMTATQYDNLSNNLTLNISLGTKTVDGEDIPDTYAGELYYVISPYTEDNQVIVTRFISPDSLSGFVHDNFRRDEVQPIIIYGKKAKLNYDVQVEI